MRDALGHADVRVFGIPADSSMARDMIEADYRMKLIGIGSQPPPVKMLTFVQALSSARNGGLQRWWFTPNYECVRISDDRLAMELVGQGVQLQSEDKVIGPGGKLLNAGAVRNKASDLFTASFTAKYEGIASRVPVYAQLRNHIDLLVAAAFHAAGRLLRSGGLAGQDAVERSGAAAREAPPRRSGRRARPTACGKARACLRPPAEASRSPLTRPSLRTGCCPTTGGSPRPADRLQAAAPADRWWWDLARRPSGASSGRLLSHAVPIACRPEGKDLGARERVGRLDLNSAAGLAGAAFLVPLHRLKYATAAQANSRTRQLRGGRSTKGIRVGSLGVNLENGVGIMYWWYIPCEAARQSGRMTTPAGC